MTSKKSDSDYKKRPRLSRTLKRRPKYRDFIEDDLKYLWVAYKLGRTGLPENLDPKEFDEYAVNLMLTEFEYGWTFIHNGKPIGFIFGDKAGPMTLLGDVIWLNDVSSRMKLEHIVNFLNDKRKIMKIIFYCTDEWKQFYLHIARHGITKRIGRINDMTEPLTLWETRWVA